MNTKRKGRTPEEIRQDQQAEAARAERGTALAKVRREGSALTADDSNPWITVGAELDKYILAPLLKFNKQGEWAVSDVESVPAGTRCVAHADEITLGWQKWLDGKPADAHIGRVADKFVPPKRSELDDSDPKEWPLQDDGTRRDPWQFTMGLPVTRLDTSTTYRFSSSSKGGLGCISGVINIFGRRIQEKKTGLPIVELQVGFYKHSRFGKIFFPKLASVNWTGEGDKPQSLADDMDDEIGI